MSPRRRVLQVLGAVSVAGVAGCLGDDDEDGPFFEVSAFEPADHAVVAGGTIEVSAEVTNTGDEDDEQDLEYRIGDEVLASETVSLAVGEDATVSFETVETGGLEGGEHTHGVYSADDGATATLTVQLEVDPPEPDPGPYEGNPALLPGEALETFALPDGWTIELVASEPLVDSPVDVKWDAAGRMWVVEMPDYMAIVPGDGEGGEPPGNYGDWGDAELSEADLTGWGDETTDEEPNGAVTVLHDPDGDGRMEEATTFRDGLTLSRSIGFADADDALAIAQAGAFLDEPDLFRCADADGDLRGDREEILLENWVESDNPEHTNNGLAYMLNNWTYSAYSSTRFRFHDGLEEADTHARGQWGLAQDDYGRIYANWNSSWLHADLVPGNGDYLLRDPDAESEHGVYEEIAPDDEVYAVRKNPGTNRSYPGGWASHRDDGRIESVTAVSAPGIYRGDAFPEEFAGTAFVPEPKANCVGRFDVAEEEDGLGLSVEHVRYDNDEWGEQEFLASTDEVFKPVTVKTGPDGALYIVDMYNGIFQHRLYLTDYLAEYYLENDLHEVPPAGRIYRVYPEDAELDEPPALDELGHEELAAQLEHPNGWVRDTAQRLLVQGGETDAAPAVREIARESDEPVARIHALWTLHGLGEIDDDSVFAAMDVEHTHVQAAAMQTGEALLGTDDAESYVDRLVEFAEAAHLRLVVQAAYSLGEVRDASLQSRAEETLEWLLEAYPDEQYVTDAVHSAPELTL